MLFLGYSAYYYSSSLLSLSSNIMFSISSSSSSDSSPYSSSESSISSRSLSLRLPNRMCLSMLSAIFSRRRFRERLYTSWYSFNVCILVLSATIISFLTCSSFSIFSFSWRNLSHYFWIFSFSPFKKLTQSCCLASSAPIY